MATKRAVRVWYTCECCKERKRGNPVRYSGGETWCRACDRDMRGGNL